MSKLDPEIYGPQESALKEEHILGQLNGMSVQQVDNHAFTAHVNLFTLLYFIFYFLSYAYANS